MNCPEPHYEERDGRDFVAMILGAHVDAITTHPVADRVLDSALESSNDTKTVVAQWVTAMELLNEPTSVTEPEKFLDPLTLQAIGKVVSRGSFSSLATKSIESTPGMHIRLEGGSLHDNVARKISEVLANGVRDSLDWVGVMRSSGLTYEEIKKHPVLPIATSMTAPAHTILKTRAMILSKRGITEPLPRTRTEAVAIALSAPAHIITDAYTWMNEPEDERTLNVRGACSALRGRSISGETWMAALLSRTVKIHEGTSPSL